VIDIMCERYEAKGMLGKTFTLKLRFADFTTITRSNTHTRAFTKEEIKASMVNLLPVDEIKERGVRLLGGTMSNFETDEQEISDQLKIHFDKPI